MHAEKILMALTTALSVVSAAPAPAQSPNNDANDHLAIRDFNQDCFNNCCYGTPIVSGCSCEVCSSGPDSTGYLVGGVCSYCDTSG